MSGMNEAPKYLAALLAAACTTSLPTEPVPPDGTLAIELRSDKPFYSLGGSAQVHITNASTETVVFGGCNDILEELIQGQWRRVPPLAFPCPELALVLAPGDSLILPFDLRPATHAGTYRLRRLFWAGTGSPADLTYRRSNAFTLLP